MKAVSIAILALALLGSAALAEPISVERVVDGDTIELTSGEHIRIQNLDTPELMKARCMEELKLAVRAQYRLEQMLLAGAVSMSRQGKDRFGRTLASVTVRGEDVAATLIREGLGLPYKPRQSSEKPGPWCGILP